MVGGVRLFIAVEPGPAAIEAIRALPRPARDGVRWSHESTWHITLRFLGELPGAEPVVAALGGTDLGPAVDVRLGPRTRRLNPNVLVVPAVGLEDLAGRVRLATADLGLPLGDKPFDGHLTIARRRRRGARIPAGEPIDAAFRADEVILFSSTLAEAGPSHDILRRWVLPDETPPGSAGVPSNP
jgi:RNA 2',3'-cyclic 3'-phosphodiesterase